MSSTSITVDAANPMLTALVNRLDTGAAAARVDVMAGTQPPPGGAATVIVGQISLQKPAGTVAAGTLTLNVPSSSALVLNASTPSWARLFDGNGVAMMDFKARLSSTPDDPEDPAVIVIDASALEVGALLRVVSGGIVISG